MDIFRKAANKVKDVFRSLKSKFDKQGSYTGTPDDAGEDPQQDADDL